MDKYEREQLLKRAQLILGEISMDMMDSDLVEHSDRKYNRMVADLSCKVEAINSLVGQKESKGFFAKMGDKINGISAEDRRVDTELLECAQMVRRLENCKGCLCIDCIRDDCKFNCSVCPDSGKVVECPSDDTGYCLRSVGKWYMPFMENGSTKQYEVLCMASKLDTGTHYLFLKGRTNDTRKVVKYNRVTNKVTAIEDEHEYDDVCNIVAKFLGI